MAKKTKEGVMGRIEVRPGLKRHVWTMWSQAGDLLYSGTMANALANGIAQARYERCQLWLLERRYDKSEHGTRIANFGDAVAE